MGPPIIKLKDENVRNKEALIQIKDVFRHAVRIERTNIIYRNLGLPYFQWLHKISTNNQFIEAWFYTIGKMKIDEHGLYQSSAPILIALSLLYHQTKDSKLETILNALRLVPQEFIPNEVRTILKI